MFKQLVDDTRSVPTKKFILFVFGRGHLEHKLISLLVIIYHIIRHYSSFFISSFQGRLFTEGLFLDFLLPLDWYVYKSQRIVYSGTIPRRNTNRKRSRNRLILGVSLALLITYYSVGKEKKICLLLKLQVQMTELVSRVCGIILYGERIVKIINHQNFNKCMYWYSILYFRTKKKRNRNPESQEKRTE